MVELDLQPNPVKELDPNEHLDKLMPQTIDEGENMPADDSVNIESAKPEIATEVHEERAAQVSEHIATVKEETTAEQEKDKVTEIRKGYYPLIARILLLTIFLDLFLVIFFLIIQSISQDYSTAAIISLVIIKLLILSYYTIYTTFKWSQTYYQFDENRLIKLVGLYNPQQTVYNLNNLYSVDVHVSMLGRMLKYGHITLVFQVQDGDRQKVEISHVVEPLETKKYFARYLK